MKSKAKKIRGQFFPLKREVLESPAWRVLSRAAKSVIERVQLEWMKHGGKDNGRLPVTFDHFVEYGIHRHAVGPAQREAEALGWLAITRGRAGNAEHRTPSLFRLTSIASDDAPATNDWKKFATTKDAENVASFARAAKPERRTKPKPKPEPKPAAPVSARVWIEEVEVETAGADPASRLYG